MEFMSCDFGKIVVRSVLEAVVSDTILAAQRSVACLLMLTGCLLKDAADVFPELVGTGKRFPFEQLHEISEAGAENKDGSDTEDDDEDDGDADDDAGDEDLSGEEGGDDDDEGDPQEDPEANGNQGSDDEDGDEEEEDQPPSKKRK